MTTGDLLKRDHVQVLKTLRLEDVPGQAPGCPQGPLIRLLSGADFGEVYVDPWEARWLCGPEGKFGWDTTDVPNGRYWIIAEIRTPKGAPRVRVSDYQITVQH